jgi:MoaA/NifB/PqqE/SkfB family radical SAM enzyme
MNRYDLKVGFSCLNDCIHCVVSDKRTFKDLTTEKVKELILKNKDNIITFTGGEPTIRKDIVELLKYSKDVGVKTIILQTMARPMKDYQLAKEIAKYVDFFLIAIHSYDSYIHDRITKRKNSWKETILAIKNLQKLNANITTQTVISKLNSRDLFKTYEFIFNVLKINAVNLTFPHANGSAWDNIDSVMPNYDDIYDEIQKILKIFNNKHISIEAIPKCILYPYQDNENFQNNDDFLLSNEKSFGFDSSLQKNPEVKDYSKLILEERKKYNFCNKCIFNNTCVGVWKEYYDYYKENKNIRPIKNGEKNESTR